MRGKLKEYAEVPPLKPWGRLYFPKVILINVSHSTCSSYKVTNTPPKEMGSRFPFCSQIFKGAYACPSQQSVLSDFQS